MSEKIQIFQNPEFGNIRTMRDEKGEPLFCAKDVCDALGYQVARKAVRDHVEEGDVLKRNTPLYPVLGAESSYRQGSVLAWNQP